MKRFIGQYHAAIDLGSSKVCCWISKGIERAGQPPRVSGRGHVASRGVSAGQFTDIQGLQASLIEALYEAEKQSHVQVRQACITLSDAFFQGQTAIYEADLPDGIVGEQDVIKLFQQVQDKDYQVMQIVPLEFAVDHQSRIKDPKGMVGRRLMGRFYITWMDRGRLETLTHFWRQCQIRPTHILPSSFTSSLACLLPDERELGVALVDLGESATTLSLFIQGAQVFSGTLLMGGRHVTLDIARGCDLSLQESERMKILHGAALVLSHDRHEKIDLALPGSGSSLRDRESFKDRDNTGLSKAFLVTVIQARYQEILGTIATMLARSAYAPFVQRIVFTGGASAIPGLRELARPVFGRNVRVAKTLETLDGEDKRGGVFASVCGALMHARTAREEQDFIRKKSFSLFSWLKRKM
jgi:cell division protein FtsA